MPLGWLSGAIEAGRGARRRRLLLLLLLDLLPSSSSARRRLRRPHSYPGEGASEASLTVQPKLAVREQPACDRCALAMKNDNIYFDILYL